MTRARLAGFATRGLALLIDCALLDVAVLTLGAALAWVTTVLGLDIDASTPVALGLAGTGWLVLLSCYLTAFWWLAGQTPGMRFMGIRVTDGHGATPGLTRSLRRLAGFYLCTLTLGAGFLLVLVDDRRRGLHDRLARTLVVHTPRRRRSDADDYTSSNPSVRARETASERERTSSLR
jgi:uncharacterized RDD family membrane protein YckC